MRPTRTTVALLLALSAALLATGGCGKRPDTPEPRTPPGAKAPESATAAETAPDLLPLAVGNRWELSAEDGARLVWEVVEPDPADEIEAGCSVVEMTLESPGAEPTTDRLALSADDDWWWARRLPLPGRVLEQRPGPNGGVRYLPRSVTTTNGWSKTCDIGPEDTGFQRAAFTLSGPWTAEVGDERLAGRTLTIKSLYGAGPDDPFATAETTMKFMDGIGPVYVHMLTSGDTAKLPDILGPLPADSTFRLSSARVGDKGITDFAMGSEPSESGESGSASAG